MLLPLRPFFKVLALALPVMLNAQYELGFSAGGYVPTLRTKNNFISYYDNEVTARPGIEPTLALSYSERLASKGADLGLSLEYAHRIFHSVNGDGGHGFGRGSDVDLDLHLLYFTIAPVVRFGARHLVGIRCGAQIGFLAGGHQQGRMWEFGLRDGVYYSTETEVNGKAMGIHGDTRLLVGVQVTPELAGKRALLVDIYANMAVTSMVDGPGGSRGTDVGVRFGYLLQRNGRPLTSLIPEGGGE